MREHEVRSCDACEYYGVGCEEKCPFELKQETVERPTLRARRRDMKAEKAGAYAKARRKLNSAENKATVTTGYKKPMTKGDNNLSNEIAHQEDVHKTKKGNPITYPKSVCVARAQAIKWAKRKQRRQKKTTRGNK